MPPGCYQTVFRRHTQTVAFNVATDKSERYRWVQKTLVKRRYLQLGKTDRGTVTRYLMKVTDDCLAQTKRLLQQYVTTGTLAVKPVRRHGFKRACTKADSRLLASMDERHGQPSGANLALTIKRAISASMLSTKVIRISAEGSATSML